MRCSATFGAALLLVGSLALSRPAATQTYVGGVLVDASDSSAVAGARVTLTRDGTPLAATGSDAEGRFHFREVRAGEYRVEVTRIGYKDARTGVVEVAAGDTVEVVVRMAPRGFALEPVTVVAHAQSRSVFLRGFHQRRAGRNGFFMTREEIDRRPFHQASDVVATAPGLRMQGSRRVGSQFERQLYTHRSGGFCPMQVYLDGVHMNRSSNAGVSLDELVSPHEIEGIEVYRGYDVPGEFLNRNSDCGTVVVWTRRG